MAFGSGHRRRSGALAFALAAMAFVLTAAAPVAVRKDGVKTWNTYPMPPHVKPADPMRIHPGIEVPDHPERIVWKVTAPANEPKLTIVPVYDFTGGRGSKIGNIPMGTELTLNEFRAVGRVNYYPVKFTPAGGAERIAWVSGSYIAPAGLAPVQ